MGDGSVVEGEDLQALDEIVLPEGHDRVRRRLAAAHGCHDEAPAAPDELLDQGGGVIVKPMRVVHQQSDRTTAPPLRNGRRRPPQQVGGTGPRFGERGQQRGHSAQGKMHRRTAGHHRRRGIPLGLGELQALVAQSGLADAGSTGEHDAALAGGEQAPHTLQLKAPTDQWPRPHSGESLTGLVGFEKGVRADRSMC